MNKKRNPQKRGEFVPIRDIAVDLPGVQVKALSERAPQARHHFTRLDQIDQLVDASEADADLGFMARLLALCSLPRTNPGNRAQYVRRNGPYTLGMSAGINNRLPLRHPAAVAPGVGLHRSGADAVARTHPRRLALRVHAESGHLQH